MNRYQVSTMPLHHHSHDQVRPSMTTSKIVCILILIAASGLGPVHGKRQKPRHDEIERVTNNTHSEIWKCSNTECPPGAGLTVQCGTSISIHIPIKCVPCVKGLNYSNTHDHSTCKNCMNCTKNENKTGECIPEEDTTECLGTCYKGFYMDKNGDCQPCSDCCNNEKMYREEQCEDSGLPPYQQCRKSNIKCFHSTKSMISQLPNNLDDEKGSHKALTILLIIIAIFFVILLIIFLVLLICYGWQKVKSFLRKWCCCCHRHGVPAEGIYSVNFHVSDQFLEGDSEAALCNVYSVSHLTEDGDVLTNLSSLSGAKTVGRPMFQRLHSVPVKTQSKSDIPRSFSHPGALNDIGKFNKLKGTLNVKADFKRPGTKKHTKKGIYTCVETEPPMIDDLLAERVDRESVPTPTTSSGFKLFSMGAADFMAHNESTAPAPTGQLLEIDNFPVENHVKNCDTKPASSGAVPGNSLQSAGSMVKAPSRERLEKQSVTDQCTSTTELYVPSTNKFSEIPQHFLNWFLSNRMSTIPIKFYCILCMKLDTTRELFCDDYRALAEEIGLGRDVILWLGQQKNKTEFILQKFDAQKDPSIRRFKAILGKIEREDLVGVIEDWVLYEWNKQNNNNLSSFL